MDLFDLLTINIIRECTRSKQIVKEKFIMLGLINIFKKNRKTQVVHEHISERIEEKELYFIPKSKIYKTVLFNGRSTLLQ